ncbi:MAG: DUF3808 domain-containing protein [Melioribacter sp.]|nr:DUF3808 domain-containing protein [Melioribacter sp.]
MKKYFHYLLIFTSIVTNSLAQSTLNQSIQFGLNKAYNMEIDEAEKIFYKLTKRYPNLPHGYFHLAQIHFWCFLGNRDQYHLNLFNQYSELAQYKINDILKENQKSYRITFMAGNLATYRAMISSINNSSVDALWYSKKAIEYYEKTLEINPKFYDAYFGLGLFDYAMSFVPDFLKWAVNLTGLTSNKKRGLEYIRTAYLKGRLDKTEISYHLAKIYADYLAAYDSSYFYLKNLIARFPKNSLFHYQYAVTMIKDRKLTNAINVLKRVIKLDNKYFSQITAFANYRIGEIYFKKNNYKRAIEHYKIFLEKTKEPDFKGLAALNVALCYKFLGNDVEYENYIKRVEEGNQDLFEDAYAKEKSEYFIENGISAQDLFLVKMKNNIDAAKYKTAFDSLKIRIDELQGDKRVIALAFLAESALLLGKLNEAMNYAEESRKINIKKEKWVNPFSNLILAKANYYLNRNQEAKNFLKEAEEENNYEFRDYLQSQIENLRRKLYRVKN